MTARPHASGSSGEKDDGPPPDWRQTLDSFAEFRRAHRGVSDGTLSTDLLMLRRFAEHVSPEGAPLPLDEIEARHVDDFLVRHARGRGRDYARRAAGTLRTFLRYLALLGHVPAELAAQVPQPRVYRLAGLPRALEHGDLRRVLRAVVRRDARGRREYAVLMVLATYGLRAGDVAALRLDDLRWRDGTIAVATGKTGRLVLLPITDPAGDAIADYLQRDRPRCESRALFLPLRPPYQALASGRITEIARAAMDRAGVRRPRGVAAHAFRHGLATRLVRNGVDLGTVAGCLGHATSVSTFIYTKLDIEDLRTVSLDPREVLS